MSARPAGCMELPLSVVASRSLITIETSGIAQVIVCGGEAIPVDRERRLARCRQSSPAGPGRDPPALGRLNAALAALGFDIVDVENPIAFIHVFALEMRARLDHKRSQDQPIPNVLTCRQIG